jgi:hypothetical protein
MEEIKPELIDELLKGSETRRPEELKNRGVKDILIACVDGLKGFRKRWRRCFRRRACNGASCTWYEPVCIT